MKLVAGGAYQGKTDYAKRRFSLDEGDLIDGEWCEFGEIYHCGAITHFHALVRRLLKEGMDAGAMIEQLEKQNPEVIVITDELGYGVVPIDAFDRAFREKHGRLCCHLASEASEVHRVVCGIGTVIKHG